MKKVNDIRTGRHCVFLLHAHLVFVTKYRYGVFTKIILDGLKEIFASVCRDFEAELIEFDGEEDHVHLLVVYGEFSFQVQDARRSCGVLQRSIPVPFSTRGPSSAGCLSGTLPSSISHAD